MSWYHTNSESPHMQQIVIDPGIINFEDSDRMLMLTSHYLRVYESFWINVIVKLDTEKYPAVIIKANESTSFLKTHPFKIGLSFLKGTRGNLFALFVEFDGPSPYNCPTKPLVFFEDFLGLDFEQNRERLTNSLDMEKLHIWLVEGGEATVYDEEEIFSAKPVNVKYEAIIDIEPECRNKINEITKEHFEQHLKIGEKNWDYKKTFEEFSANMPVTISPILKKSGEEQNTAALKESSFLDKSGEREAKHIVIFVKGDPSWKTIPESIFNTISSEAEKCGVVITSTTEFSVFRNSDENVESACRGESVALFAIMELAIKLGTGMEMVNNFLDGKILVKEVFCIESDSDSYEKCKCAVVMICL